MKKVAVIAHAGKTIGGGLEELRITLSRAGITDPIWSEVPKSRFAPESVTRSSSSPPPIVLPAWAMTATFFIVPILPLCPSHAAGRLPPRRHGLRRP